MIMTFLLYQLYSWFRGTRAIQVLLGLGVVTLIYFVTRFLGLYMTSWVLQELGTVLIILIIVVFQSEIRQALYRLSLLRHMIDIGEDVQHHQFQEIAESVFSMATKRTGALLVFEHHEPLNDLVSNGVNLDCEITPRMIESIFYNGAPMHDGAALLRNGRIAQAAGHLPLSTNPEVPHNLGTRHRAALGLTERCDAITVVVSEERGEVSLVMAGKLKIISSATELVQELDNLLCNKNPAPRPTIHKKIFSNLLPKMAILLGVCVFWALITTRQGQIATTTAPVILHGVPESLVLLKTTPEQIEVQLKSLSSLSPPPSKIDLTVELDASEVKEGVTNVRIRNSDLNLPSGLSVMSIKPSNIRVSAEKKLRKSVPIKATLRGRLPNGLSPTSVTCEPSRIEIEGPSSLVSSVDTVFTEDIDATKLKKGGEYKTNIRPLQNQISLSNEGTVTIRVSARSKR